MGELQTLSRDAIHAELRRIELLQQLSARELDVLRRLARGQKQRAMATELSTSPTAVKSTVISIMRELGARNAVNAVAIAYEAGLLVTGDACEVPDD